MANYTEFLPQPVQDAINSIVPEMEPLTSIAVSPALGKLIDRTNRLKDVTRALLEKDGKLDAWSNYGKDDPLDITRPDFSLDPRRPPNFRKECERDYRKCFDLSHEFGISGAWILLIGDLIRPIDDNLPLLVDLIDDLVEQHPGPISFGSFTKRFEEGNPVNIEVLRDARDKFREAANDLKAKYPEAFENELRPFSDIEITADTDLIDENAILAAKAFLSINGGKLTTQYHIVHYNVVVAIFVIGAIWSGYTTAEYFLDKVYNKTVAEIEAARKRKEAADAQAKAEQEKRERERKEAEKWWHDKFGDKGPSASKEASDHVDSFERNKDKIERTA